MYMAASPGPGRHCNAQGAVMAGRKDSLIYPRDPIQDILGLAVPLFRCSLHDSGEAVGAAPS